MFRRKRKIAKEEATRMVKKDVTEEYIKGYNQALHDIGIRVEWLKFQDHARMIQVVKKPEISATKPKQPDLQALKCQKCKSILMTDEESERTFCPVCDVVEVNT